MQSDFQKLRVGQGYDSHRLVEGRDFILGGLKIEHDKGLDGHSDADVLLHAVIDSVLGATGQGDIGRWFPDTDPEHKDACSKELLNKVWASCQKEGWTLVNVDCVVCLEKPKLVSHIEAIERNIAELLNGKHSQVNVKATTGEKMGFVGRGEGVFSSVTILLYNESLKTD